MTPSDQPHAGSRSRQLWIPAGRHELEAELELPAGARGLVIFAHGGGNGCHSTCNQYVAQSVREHGLGSLLLDLMTRGEAIDAVTRRVVPFDIDLLADRLADAIRWISRTPDLAGLHLGCFGDFTGSAATLMAATSDLPIAAIVSRGGRPDLAGIHLERVRVPTLLIAGAGDAGLLQHNQEAFDRLHCEKRMEVLPGVTHRVEAAGGLDAVADLAVHWFVEKLHLEPVAS